MKSITRSEFLKMVRLHHLEVLTQNQLSQNTNIVKGYIEKSLTDELSDIEKSEANTIITELASYDQWSVMNDDFSKAVCYTRPEQIQWEEPVRGEYGEIIKAKGGVYKPTAENKKLGRVGQKYGESKSEGNTDHISKDPKAAKLQLQEMISRARKAYDSSTGENKEKAKAAIDKYSAVLKKLDGGEKKEENKEDEVDIETKRKQLISSMRRSGWGPKQAEKFALEKYPDTKK